MPSGSIPPASPNMSTHQPPCVVQAVVHPGHPRSLGARGGGIAQANPRLRLICCICAALGLLGALQYGWSACRSRALPRSLALDVASPRDRAIVGLNNRPGLSGRRRPQRSACAAEGNSACAPGRSTFSKAQAHPEAVPAAPSTSIIRKGGLFSAKPAAPAAGALLPFLSSAVMVTVTFVVLRLLRARQRRGAVLAERARAAEPVPRRLDGHCGCSSSSTARTRWFRVLRQQCPAPAVLVGPRPGKPWSRGSPPAGVARAKAVSVGSAPGPCHTRQSPACAAASTTSRDLHPMRVAAETSPIESYGSRHRTQGTVWAAAAASAARAPGVAGAGPVMLRPRQKDMVERALPVLRDRGNTLLVAPTGAGKTVIFSDIVAKVLARAPPGSKACVLAHRDELTGQNRRRFGRMNPRLATGVFNAAQKSWAGDVTFAMVQTLTRPTNLDTLPPLALLVCAPAAATAYCVPQRGRSRRGPAFH